MVEVPTLGSRPFLRHLYGFVLLTHAAASARNSLVSLPPTLTDWICLLILQGLA